MKAYQARSKSVDDIKTELVTLKRDLMKARVANATRGQQQASKTNAIHDVRKNIARMLTVLSEKRHLAAKEACKGKDVRQLRAKKTRAMRRALTPAQKALKTASQKTRESNFPMRKFVIRA